MLNFDFACYAAHVPQYTHMRNVNIAIKICCCVCFIRVFKGCIDLYNSIHTFNMIMSTYVNLINVL